MSVYREPGEARAFYILWNPYSNQPPTYKFATREAAETSAVDMARTYGGIFYVCRAESLAKPPVPHAVLSVLAEEDEAES